MTVTRDKQQHRARPRAAPSPHGAQCGGDQEQGVLENAEGEEKQEEKRRCLGKMGWQGMGAEAWRPPAHSGGALSTASAPRGRAAWACPQAVPCPSQPAGEDSDHSSSLLSVIQKQIPEKKASVFFQVHCKPGNFIQQDLLQHKLLLPCAALREVFKTLRSLPGWHQGVHPGEGQGAFRAKDRNPLAHISCDYPGSSQGRK